VSLTVAPHVEAAGLKDGALKTVLMPLGDEVM
jgi:hypothetical protein